MSGPNFLGSPRATEITEERWQIALEWLGSLDRPRAGEFLALWLQYQERFVELCEVRGAAQEGGR